MAEGAASRQRQLKKRGRGRRGRRPGSNRTVVTETPLGNTTTPTAAPPPMGNTTTPTAAPPPLGNTTTPMAEPTTTTPRSWTTLPDETEFDRFSPLLQTDAVAVPYCSRLPNLILFSLVLISLKCFFSGHCSANRFSGSGLDSGLDGAAPHRAGPRGSGLRPGLRGEGGRGAVRPHPRHPRRGNPAAAPHPGPRQRKRISNPARGPHLI